MLSKNALKKKQTLFLNPYDRETKSFLIALNKSFRFEIL